MLLSPRVFKTGLLVLIVLGAVFFLVERSKCDCKRRISYANIQVNDGINRESLFQPADSQEIVDIKQKWRQFDLAIDSANILQRLRFGIERELLVVANDKDGQRHFGALLLPAAFDSTQKYPLLLWANGLNQADPTVFVTNNRLIDEVAKELKDYFIIIPSYRGQALQTYYTRYCSDGFFGDAFDGATDDALRLLHWTRNSFSSVDTQRMALFGVSRGGTVGLLAASRYRQLNCVVAQSGPTNFLSRSVAEKYGKQYRYQFLGEASPIPVLREKMIKSSPLYFAEDYPGDLLLVYGKKDWTVPISNGHQLQEKLNNKENLEFVTLAGGHSAAYTSEAIQWIREHNRIKE